MACLGSAYHVKRGFVLVFRLPLGHEDGLEDGVLQGVGVLEFVDKRGLPVGGKGVGKGLGVWVLAA